MSEKKLLILGGTHGNEINAPWLLKQWQNKPSLIDTHGIKFFSDIGNPLAMEKCLRYIDMDLNRTFYSEILQDLNNNAYEVLRARSINHIYGKGGSKQSQFVFDFHSTTANMGTCIVLYGRRPADLAIASFLQYELGLPVYLYEKDLTQKGFLVEYWPCGIVVEIGPVAQGVLCERIVSQTLLVLSTIFNLFHKLKKQLFTFPETLIIHSHLRSVDFPRDGNGNINGFVHPNLDGKDWLPLNKDTCLFSGYDIEEKFNESKYSLMGSEVPLFINEAAYREKGIALSLTRKETIMTDRKWVDELISLM